MESTAIGVRARQGAEEAEYVPFLPASIPRLISPQAKLNPFKLDILTTRL
jgi:hypothetical protein